MVPSSFLVFSSCYDSVTENIQWSIVLLPPFSVTVLRSAAHDFIQHKVDCSCLYGSGILWHGSVHLLNEAGVHQTQQTVCWLCRGTRGSFRKIHTWTPLISAIPPRLVFRLIFTSGFNCVAIYQIETTYFILRDKAVENGWMKSKGIRH